MAGKDNGNQYFSASSLRESDTALAVVESSDTTNVTLNRLPVLLSGSTFIPWPSEGVVLEIVEDVYAWQTLGISGDAD